MSESWSFSWSWVIDPELRSSPHLCTIHHLWSTGYALYTSRGTPSTDTKSSKSAIIVTNRNLQLDLILLRALNPLSQLALAMAMTETSSYTARVGARHFQNGVLGPINFWKMGSRLENWSPKNLMIIFFFIFLRVFFFLIETPCWCIQCFRSSSSR